MAIAYYKDFKIETKFVGNKAALWDMNGTNNTNHNTVRVLNNENEKSCTFDFWGSNVHPRLSTEYDVLNAFYCIVSDALAGYLSYDDFCSEFGYDASEKSAVTTYKGCVKLKEELELLYDGDLYELANDVADAGYC